ncbi:MAG: FCD domain-containing protein, partial [Pseudomonadales bacterium]|nr:FCD domain-containing protein [Pseudomonadales bacterium]
FEILEMRLLIEPEACALAAERISDDQLQQLGNIYDEMRRTSGTIEMETSDSQFHKLIAEATENTAIARTVSWLWALRDKSELSRGFHRLIIEEGVYPVLHEHKAIFKALENRDPIAAKKAMLKHLEASTVSAAQHFSS